MTTTFAAILVAILAAPGVLVESADLSKLSGALVVDARDRDAFETGHIPGAAQIDVNGLSEERDGVTGLLKAREALLPLLAQAGLDPSKTLVVCSGMDDSGSVLLATRLFWILEYMGYPEVRLLNGGLAKWKAESRPAETGASTAGPIPVDRLGDLRPVPGRLATRGAVLEARAAKGLILDLRGEDYFTGAEQSGSVARAGHITGAKNVPGAQFMEEPHFTFKSPEAIRDVLESAGSRPGSPVITYCNTGRIASVGYVVHRIAGLNDVALYDGSMSEWSRYEECPVSTGSGE
jgi:thiosulfate/3-mercaptopyruvate sulfurtransferase